MKRESRKRRWLSLRGTRGSSCVVCQQPHVTTVLRSAKDVLACLRPFRDKRQEYFVTLSIDSGGRLIKRRVVTIGLLDASLVHPREVFAGPLADRAASVIINHNHPSGDVQPSREDIKTTEQLMVAGKILGLLVQDHIIISTDSYFSFLEEGLMSSLNDNLA